MAPWTRRDVLKGGLAASIAGFTAQGTSPQAPADVEVSYAPPGEAATPAALPSSSPRERLLLDFGWRFHLGHASDPRKDFGFGALARESTFAKSGDLLVGDVNFDHSGWRRVDLPHDWAVELPFKKEEVSMLSHHGAKPIGRDYPATSIGWYRRVFHLSEADSEKRIAVEFDGVFRRALVIFNGHYIGESFSGYAPFRFDLTDLACAGCRNVVAVRVDATLGEGWFYEGAGIYRHVWLTKTNPLHVVQWGTQVTSKVSGNSALVEVSTELVNESDHPRTCHVVAHLVDPHGKILSAKSNPATLSPWERRPFRANAKLSQPLLWSVDDPHPHLYRAITSVVSDAGEIDRDQTTFGIRTASFDPDLGFRLNGKTLKIKGTSNHQDHAGVGTAIPDRLQEYRVQCLKDMGSNACRTAHNPATPEFLDACDRLGMLVMAEARMMSSSPEGLSQLESMILRDRNHPSIVIWSLGNEEEREQGTPRGARIVASMKRLAHRLDSTRPVTLAMNGGWGSEVSTIVDVQGCNYYWTPEKGLEVERLDVDTFHHHFPHKPMIGSETASAWGTRGIYEDDPARGYVSAYDRNPPLYGETAEQWWRFYDARPFLAGGFVWTGFDYRGEPSPYAWPCVSSHFGIMDTCGFPKDSYYYYQAWWRSEPVLHLFPHWNWSRGQEIDVWCHTNRTDLEGVELLLNGASLGPPKRVDRNSHLEWKVRFEPGVLEARAMKDGQVILRDRRETTGPAARLVLHPHRQRIAADGEDLSVIRVEVVDAHGRVVPTASHEVRFAVAGPGRLIGVGNGDPSCHESDKGDRRSAFSGLCMAIVQALRRPGDIRVEASAANLDTAFVVLQAEQPDGVQRWTD